MSAHDHPFDLSIAYSHGEWQKLGSLAWSVTDLATTQGVLLVERLRTAGGELVNTSQHFQRLRQSAEMVAIKAEPAIASMEKTCQELIDRNRLLVEKNGDVGVVILLSPGDPGIAKNRSCEPSAMMHLSPMPWRQLERWYREGSSLFVSQVRNVPPESWSPWIKTRSRLQYYLADSAAHRQHGPDAIAVLLSNSGHVTETSVANLLIVDQKEKIISPRLDHILQGVSLQTVEKLLNNMGRSIHYEDISPDMLCEACEVWLTGTTGLLWSATSIDGLAIGSGRPGSLLRKIQSEYATYLGIDYLAQAADHV